jgi:hypothetical protein
MSNTQPTLVFRAGAWHTVTLPFSDPLWTAGHRQFAAGVVVREQLRGASRQQAEMVAEKAVFDQIYAGSRGKSIMPQSTRKKMPV